MGRAILELLQRALQEIVNDPDLVSQTLVRGKRDVGRKDQPCKGKICKRRRKLRKQKRKSKTIGKKDNKRRKETGERKPKRKSSKSEGKCGKNCTKARKSLG